MTMTIRKAIATAALLIFGNAVAAQTHAPWPGGIAVVSIDGDARPTVQLGDRPVMVVGRDGDWIAIVGIPLDHDAAVPLEITIERAGVATETIAVDIREASYRVQRLNVDRKYVDPGQEALDRIFAERKIIDAALTNWRDQEVADVALQAPVAGRRSSSFGSRRNFRRSNADLAIHAATPADRRVPARGLGQRRT